MQIQNNTPKSQPVTVVTISPQGEVMHVVRISRKRGAIARRAGIDRGHAGMEQQRVLAALVRGHRGMPSVVRMDGARRS